MTEVDFGEGHSGLLQWAVWAVNDTDSTFAWEFILFASPAYCGASQWESPIKASSSGNAHATYAISAVKADFWLKSTQVKKMKNKGWKCWVLTVMWNKLKIWLGSCVGNPKLCILTRFHFRNPWNSQDFYGFCRRKRAVSNVNKSEIFTFHGII